MAGAAVGAAVAYPTKSEAETDSRVAPMTRRTVPVTTGGKKRIRAAK